MKMMEVELHLLLEHHEEEEEVEVGPEVVAGGRIEVGHHMSRSNPWTRKAI